MEGLQPMSGTVSTSTTHPQADSIATADGRPGDVTVVSRYRLDHQNPVNHFLHVGVGWPMMALAVIIVPFRPYWSIALFFASYAIMFFGHFVFERNVPTLFEKPSTPFVMAYAVSRQLWTGVLRLARPRRAR
jgi:hypothetical protein